MSREKKQSFMGGVTVMAISTVFVKICGALYKIPLNNILGDEGLTHFNSAYYIYALLLSLSTAGLPLALSKLISEANATGRRTQMRRCLNTAMAIFAVLGAVGSAVMLIFTRQLAAAMNNTLAYWPIKCLGISVVCVSVMCAYRGFAQGQQNMVPTATSQFIEAFFKLVVGLPLAWYLISIGKSLEVDEHYSGNGAGRGQIGADFGPAEAGAEAAESLRVKTPAAHLHLKNNRGTMKYFCIYLFAVNLTAFALMGRDKSLARRHRRRIPEKTLVGFGKRR